MGNNDLSKELLIKCQWCIGSSTLKNDNTTYQMHFKSEKSLHDYITERPITKTRVNFISVLSVESGLGCQLIVHNNEGVIKV